MNHRNVFGIHRPASARGTDLAQTSLSSLDAKFLQRFQRTVAFLDALAERLSLGLFAVRAIPTMLRRLHDNVRDARVVHLLVQRGQVFLHELLHLRRGIAHQRSQLRELLLLLAARRRRKTIEIAQKTLRLPRQWFWFPLERRTGIAQAFPLANELFRHFIDLLLQVVGCFLYFLRNLRRVRLAGVGFPLSARRAKRLFHALDRSAILIGGFLHGIELIDGRSPRGPVLRGNLDAWIFFNDDFLGGLLRACFDLDSVFSRIDERPARTLGISGGDGFQLFWRRLHRGIVAKVPIGAVHPGSARSVELTQHFSIFVAYRDFDLALSPCFGGGLVFFLRRRFALFFLFGLCRDCLIFFVALRRLGWHCLFQVVVQNRAVRRVLRGEEFLPAAPAPHAYVKSGGRVWRKERQIAARDAGVHFLDGRQVVQNPDRAAVRGQHQIIFPRLYLDVVDRHRGKIIFQRGPICAAVPGNPQTKFHAGKKQVLIPRMLAHNVHASRRLRNGVANRLPALAIVAGHKNVDRIIVTAVAIECRVGGTFSRLRGHHAADIGSLRHARNPRSHIFPALSTVARHLQVPIISSDPQHIRGQRRFAERGDRRILLYAVVPR